MQKQTKPNRMIELLENLLLCNRISNKKKTWDPNRWTVKVFTSHFDGPPFFCYLFCYIKEDSQAILSFCLVWSVFASIRDMLPIKVMWFWYCIRVRAIFPPVNYFIVPPFGFYGCFFAGLFSPQFTLTLRVLPSGILIEDAVAHWPTPPWKN